MSKYPYIGKTVISNVVVLFESEDTGWRLEEGTTNNSHLEYANDWDENNFTDITREYLAKTWGVVESPEHAEQIKSLAAKYEFKAGLYDREAFFSFYGDSLEFYDKEALARQYCEKITIPFSKVRPTHKEGSDSLSSVDTSPSGNTSSDNTLEEWPTTGDKVIIKEALDLGDSHLQRFVGCTCEVLSVGITPKGDKKVLSLWHQRQGAISCVMGDWIAPVPEDTIKRDIAKQITDAIDLDWSPADIAEFLTSHYNISEKE